MIYLQFTCLETLVEGETRLTKSTGGRREREKWTRFHKIFEWIKMTQKPLKMKTEKILTHFFWWKQLTSGLREVDCNFVNGIKWVELNLVVRLCHCVDAVQWNKASEKRKKQREKKEGEDFVGISLKFRPSRHSFVFSDADVSIKCNFHAYIKQISRVPVEIPVFLCSHFYSLFLLLYCVSS